MSRTSAHGMWDFGLSALAQAFQDVWTHGTADEVIASVASRHGCTLLTDVVRLLESPLSDRALMAVWQAATGRNYDLEHGGIDVRDWLNRIADIARRRITEEGAGSSGPPSPVHAELVEDVLSEIRPTLAALDEATRHPHRRISGAVAALESVVTEVDPDLGFRLFLRSIVGYRVPITEAQYQGYRALADRFGYGEHHLHGVDGLIGFG
ncbi:hypothetical protein ACWEPM_34290 [Streptomyces sp. NPDC004244]